MCPSSTILELRDLLAAKFPQPPQTGKRLLPTGLTRLDTALDGGLAMGAMTEIVCPGGGGGLLLAGLLMVTLRLKGLMALEDGTDCFDPAGMPQAALPRLL